MNYYPRLRLRLKASIVDATIIGVLLYSSAYVSGYFNPELLLLKIVVVFLPVVNYEPLFIYFSGSTLGHKVFSLKVISQGKKPKLTLFQAYARFVVKLFIGIYSLLMMLVTRKHQTFHDVITGTLMTISGDAKVISKDKIQDKGQSFNASKSVARKTLVSFLYSGLILILMSFAGAMVGSPCLDYGFCKGAESFYADYADVILLVSLLLVWYLGFSSKLPGTFQNSDE